MSWPRRILELVRRRAADRCEYCLMHQSLQGGTFHVEHIIPKARGGSSRPSNLAWCCPGCNLKKGDRTEVIDPLVKSVVPLFHPRKDYWTDHFRFQKYRLIGLTPVGRAMIAAFGLNHSRRVLIRQVEETIDLFPPE